MASQKRKVLYVSLTLVAGCWAAANYNAQSKWRFRGRHAGGLQDLLRCYGDSDYPSVPIHPGKRGDSHYRAGGRHRSRGADWARGIGLNLSVGRILVVLITALFGSTLQNAINDAKGIASTIVNWIVGIITDVEQDIDDVVDAVANAVWKVIDTLDTWAVWVGNELGYFLAWTTNFLGTIGSDIINWCVTTATDLVNDAKAALTDTINFITALINDAISDLQNGLNWLQNVIVAPLISFFDGIESWWASHIAGWWDDTYQDVIAPIEADLTADWGYLSTVWQWVELYGNELASVMRSYWDNFVAFLSDPIGYSVALVQKAFSQNTLDWVVSQANSAESDFAGWAQDVEGWFGL